MKCPACAHRMNTVETRDGGKPPLEYVRRRKECPKCFKRITTSEVIVDEGIGADIMVVKSAAMEELLQTMVSAFAGRLGDETISNVVEALLKGRGTPLG